MNARNHITGLVVAFRKLSARERTLAALVLAVVLTGWAVAMAKDSPQNPKTSPPRARSTPRA